VSDADRLHLRGGLPRSALAASDAAAASWREQYIRSLLSSDLPALGLKLPPPAARRLWTMLAHAHGRVLNASDLSRSFGMSDHAVRANIDLLESALLVRVLQPWHANVSKRQVKAPKVYIADSGVLHGLLGRATAAALGSHPSLGASWEGFALSQVAQRLSIPRDQRWFWGTHGGAELDLCIETGGRRVGFECTRTEAPSTTRSMHVAIADLGLDELVAVHAGSRTYPVADRILALALSRLGHDLSATGAPTSPPPAPPPGCA
jgi:predicted AAA+ superfamily ATPase